MGKVAIVCGGATGLGKAICKLFAREGARVVVNGLERDPIDQVVEEIQATGGFAIGCPVDAGSVAGAAHIIRDTCVALGRLDILIASSDVVLEPYDLEQLPPARFEELVRSCVRGVYYACRAALPALRESHGAILTAVSVGHRAIAGFLTEFVRALAAEQGRHGVRANAILVKAGDSPEHVAEVFARMTSPGTPIGPDDGMLAVH